MHDNLKAFNAMITAGQSPESAAMATLTGKMAARYGFNKPRVLSLTGDPGSCTKVEVVFGR